MKNGTRFVVNKEHFFLAYPEDYDGEPIEKIFFDFKRAMISSPVFIDSFDKYGNRVCTYERASYDWYGDDVTDFNGIDSLYYLRYLLRAGDETHVYAPYEEDGEDAETVVFISGTEY